MSAQKKSKKNCYEGNNDEDVLMQTALAVMNKQPDDLEIFGQFVASEMKQITNTSIRQVVKTQIMKVLLRFASPSENNQLSENCESETHYIIIENDSELDDSELVELDTI